MANARLHTICGNCGCKDLFTLQIIRNGDDVSVDANSKFVDAVYLRCDNCATHHDLKDNANEVEYE